MKRKILTLTTVFAFIYVAVQAQGLSQFNQEVDTFLGKYVSNGNVDYKAIKDNFNDVDRLYKSLATVDLKNASANEQKAFYINAYNIIVIHQIAKYYPLKSALDRNGFFDKVRHSVAGESLTLDHIEKGKVILKFKDPRVHFAFSCAAKGCPELANFAFRADKLDAQLDERTKNSLNNPEFIKINEGDMSVDLSMIFKWYNKDFTMSEPSVLAYVNKYRTKKIPASYAVDFYDYDWSLNIQ